MYKKKEVVKNYRKRIQELDDAVIRSRVHFLNQIKKETVRSLIRLGDDEFEALKLLEELNDSWTKCNKCGSTLTRIKC